MKWKYNKETKTYSKGDWEVQGYGGFCTVRHFWATSLITGDRFWRFKLRDVKKCVEDIEGGYISYQDIGEVFKRSLYI